MRTGYMLFVWTGKGIYRPQNALTPKVYASEKVAQKAADKLVDKGQNVVVRTVEVDY